MAEGASGQPRSVPGVRLGSVAAGIRSAGGDDLVLIEVVEGTRCAAVFTRNAFCAAPVTVARENLATCANQPRFLLINAGNANAGTGSAGMAAARACVDAVALAGSVDAARVLPFSTGVIGEPLPVDLIEAALPGARSALSEEGWSDAARGILTTDTHPKLHSVTFNCEGRDYVVTGMAKGAGMIRPDMATMLAYIATDAAVEAALLQEMLQECTDRSFNRITVDGDTSTNDACVLLATGEAGNECLTTRNQPLYGALRDAVADVCTVLAQAIVRDGEGASKFVTVQVNGGHSETECLDVAFTIAHSPLVKTALFASDPNWGRILAAIGRAGLSDLVLEDVSLYVNEVLIAENGGRAAAYTEEQGVAAMAPDEIVIRVELGRGKAQAVVWTTDLSYDYVRINAEYRT